MVPRESEPGQQERGLGHETAVQTVGAQMEAARQATAEDPAVAAGGAAEQMEAARRATAEDAAAAAGGAAEQTEAAHQASVKDGESAENLPQ